jgi:hypothetical protein
VVLTILKNISQWEGYLKTPILVGGIPTPLKKYACRDDEIPNIWKVIKFHGSKPPISFFLLWRYTGDSITNI